jgi:hypothetical protein
MKNILYISIIILVISNVYFYDKLNTEKQVNANLNQEIEMSKVKKQACIDILMEAEKFINSTGENILLDTYEQELETYISMREQKKIICKD